MELCYGIATDAGLQIDNNLKNTGLLSTETFLPSHRHTYYHTTLPLKASLNTIHCTNYFIATGSIISLRRINQREKGAL